MCKKRCTHIVDCSNRPSGTRAALLHSGTPQWCIPAIQMKFWHTDTFIIAYMSILIRDSVFLIDKGFSFFFKSTVFRIDQVTFIRLFVRARPDSLVEDLLGGYPRKIHMCEYVDKNQHP